MSWHLVAPKLTFLLLLVLLVLGIAGWVVERLCPTWRGKNTWLHRVSDNMVRAVYAGGLLSVPSIYYDAWRAGLPGPSMSRTAQVVIILYALGVTALAWRVSGVAAIRGWKENNGLPISKRAFRSMGAVLCPFTAVERFESREKV